MALPSYACVHAGRDSHTVIAMPGWEDFEPVDSPVPIYVQVADFVAARIDVGELAHGAKLPAERDLASLMGVAYETIRRATALLRDRELITTTQGRGTYIR